MPNAKFVSKPRQTHTWTGRGLTKRSEFSGPGAGIHLLHGLTEIQIHHLTKGPVEEAPVVGVLFDDCAHDVWRELQHHGLFARHAGEFARDAALHKCGRSKATALPDAVRCQD